MSPFIKLLTASVLFLVMHCGEVSAASRQKFITDDYPPYNYLNEKGEMVGISVEILKKVMPGVLEDFTTQDIEQLPWARAYQKLQQATNATLFTMIKTKEREKMFKFIGPISTSNMVIVSKNPNLQINKIDDLASYRVAVVRDGLGDQLTRKTSYKKLPTVRVLSPEQVTKLLINDRVDAVILDESIIKYQLKTFGENPENYHLNYSINHSGSYFAFNKDVDPNYFAKFQSEFTKLKENGVINQIYLDYFDSL